MFRNKIMVRAKPAFVTSSSPFFLIQLRLYSPSSSSSSSPAFVTDSSFLIKLEALCWKLSRAWSVACLCFPPSPDVFVIYQRSQSESADQVVKEVVRELPVSDVGPEEQMAPSSLLVKGIECSLRCAFLASGWSCLENDLFVDSDFSRDHEKSYLCAVHVRVQLAMDGVIFLVSPDVIRFSRYKLADLLSPKVENIFGNGMEITLEGCNSAQLCYILPSLDEGNVIGLGKLLPSGENWAQFEEFWSLKHGLAFSDDYFIKTQFCHEGLANEKWVPSTFVLQGSSFARAPLTTRIAKAVSAFNSFIKIVEGWNFFGQRWLLVQILPIAGDSSCHSTCIKASEAANAWLSTSAIHHFNIENTSTRTSIFNNILSAIDFRTPKFMKTNIAFGKLDPSGQFEDVKNTSKISECDTNAQDAVPLDSAAKFSPLFLKHTAPMKSFILDTKVRGTAPRSSSPCKATGGIAAKEIHISDMAHTNNKTKYAEDIAGKFKSAPLLKSWTSQERIKSKAILDGRSSTSTKEGLGSDVVIHPKQDQHASNKRKNICRKDDQKGDDVGSNKHKRVKTQTDASTVTAKVLDCHARGQLESLTVADLKCFLATKKAKVGGRKEDIVQRVAALISS